MKISNLAAILLLIIAGSQHLTAQQQSQLDCSAKLDIFFLLDASDSLTEEDFGKEKELVMNLLQRLIDDSRDAKAGYLTFTESVNNVRTLLSNLAIVKFELRDVIFDQEGTNLLVPLEFAYSNIFKSNSDLRPDSKRILFQITDGRDEFSSIAQLSNISRLLGLENVTTVAIGVGDLIDITQLSAIATQPHEQNLIIFSDLNEALANISNIIDRTCTIPRVNVLTPAVQSSTSITVRWTSYSFATVNSYKICFETDAVTGECNVTIHNINPSLNETLVENLIPNTGYFITVFAFTDIGITPFSNVVEVTLTEAPGSSLQLNATSVSSSSIRITWQAASGSGITNYEICVSLSPGGSCAYSYNASVASLEYVQSGLESNTTYFFRIRAINSGGFGAYSSESSATTALLGGPSLLSAVQSSYHVITLTWDAYTEASVSSFEICVRLEGSSSCAGTFSALGSATSYTVTQLEAYTLYEVGLVAITSSSRSADSNSIIVRTGEKRPGGPTNVSAAALSPLEIRINWSSPASNELYGVIREYYICVRGQSGESCLFEITHNASVTPFSVALSGLSPGTVYRVRVRAINGGGAGSYSDDYLVTTESVSAVTVSVSAISSNSITVVWTGGNIPTTEITGAVISLTTVSTGAVQIINVGQAGSVSGSYLLEQVLPGTQYTITVVVTTSAGDTPVSNELSVGTQETTPTGVPTLTSTSHRSTSITLTLDSIPLLQRNGIILFYIVYYRADGASSFSSTAVPVSDQSASIAYTLYGLNPSTAYTVEVSGNNSVGEGPRTQSVSITTAVSGAVQNLSSVATSRFIAVSYAAYTETQLIGYRACFRTSSLGACTQTQNTTGLAFYFTGLDPGQTYYITVIAVTQFGDSEESQQLIITTYEEAPGAPNNLTVSLISVEGIGIGWTAISSDQANGVVTEYIICIKEANSQNCNFTQTVNATSQTFSLNQTGLTPNTNYVITVQGRNSAGLGDTVETTIQTESLQAVTLSAQTVDEHRIRLTWSDPNVPTSLITGGILTSVGSPSGSGPSFDIELSKAISQDFIAEGFYPATTYYFTLRIRTTLGVTPVSNEASTTTIEAVPSGIPTNFRAETISASSIQVTWSPLPPELTNGVITMYTICFGLEIVTCSEVTVNASQPLEYTLTDLEPETQYLFRIRAHTAVGAGPYTDSINQTTSKPGGLEIQNITATSATTVDINWIQLNFSISYYEICVLITETENCSNPIRITDETQIYYTIVNLQPYTMYYVTISATTAGGYEISSPQRSVRTQEQPPSSPPTNVTVTTESDTTLTITWESVVEGDRNGVITVYEVCVQTVSGGPCVFTFNVTAPETRVNVTGLTDNTDYIVTIRAHTSVGPGPYSPEVAVTTLHSLPGEAVVVITVERGPTVVVSGNISQTGGPTTGVQVCVRLPSTTECINVTILVTNGTSFNVTIEDLDPNQTYEVIVNVTGPGGNTVTSPVTITTEPEPPSSPPTNVTVTTESDTTLTITWESVVEGDRNGVITVYEVCVQTVSGGPCVFTFNVTAPETRVNVTGLTDNTDYIVTIRAHTSVGPGPYSPEVAVTTLHSLPGEAVVVITVERGPTVVVSGNISQTGGPTTGVQVCVRLPSTTECINVTILVTNGTSFNVIIEDLDPNQTYEVIVNVTGPGGNTVTSPVTITTEPEPPSSPPTNVTVTTESDTTLTITWESVVDGDRNGVITIYEVCVQAVSGGPCVFAFNVTAPETRVNVTGLTNNTDYIVTIRAHTSVGPGPYSPEVAVTTLHSLPGEAVVVITVQRGPTVVVSGNISQTGGPTTGVQVCVRLPSTTECINVTILVTNGTSFNVTIEDLDPNQTYEVIVNVTGPGGNTVTSPVTITTEPELPSGSVQDIQISSGTTVSRINWTQPVAINDETITYYVTISIGGVILSTSQISNETVVFTGLNPNTEYEVVITPSNSVGNGTSVTVIVRTQQEQPEPLQIVSVLTNSVQVTLTPLNTTSTSIQIKHYEICLQLSTTGTCDRTLIITPNEILTFTIQNLTPNTVYRITVFAVSVNDERGPASQVVTFRTIPLAPTDAVTNLGAVVNSLFSLEVDWDFNATSQESAPTHFFLCLALQSGGDCNITRNVTADMFSVVISKVEGNTVYYITVTPWNGNGPGPITAIMITVPEISAPAVTITATALSPYEIHSEWESTVIFLNITSFTICLSVEGSSVCSQTGSGQLVNNGEFIFSGLTPNTSYTVHIVELISETSGAFTQTKTPIDRILDSPLNVQVTTVSSTILRVTWVPSGQTQFSNLTSWEVCYEAERFNETSGCSSSERDQLYKSLLSLEEYEHYSVTVRAVYTNGSGTAFSVPVRGRTEEDVPSRAISGLVGVTEAGESKFTWLAPPIRDQNGIIVYYLVVFEYEDNEGLKNISIRENPLMRETNIPYLVTIPYNISVTPYTIGAGPPYKIIGAKQEPVTAEALCPDWRIAVTILCVVLAILIIMAIVMCCIILILIVSKSKSTYSAV